MKKKNKPIPSGMHLYIMYKNKQVKDFFNVRDFDLIDGDLLIWICYKSKPILRRMKNVSDFFCEY